MKKINPQHAIELKHIIKNYVVHHEKPTLMETLFNGKNQRFTALKGIDLTIKKGERVGIIGPNGSGKTTLLKIIAGIASPTSGEVLTDGKVVSLIDLEAGFHPDLTGIQNIFLNGVLLGMSKKEIANNMDSIVNFANIGKFIDAQLFTYSEGMKLRLGFSVAIHSDPDILILDENIAVGDQEFRKAAFKKVKELFKKGKTVVIVSHNMDFISKNCQRVIWLEKGKIIEDSKSKSVISRYTHS